MTNRKPITTDRTEEKECYVSMKDHPNLYPMVRPNETKSWIFRYISPTMGKRDKISFGIYPSVALSRACELWQEHSDTLSKNIDPKAYQEQQKEATKQKSNTDNTFRFHSEQYFNTLTENLKDNTLNRKCNCVTLLNSYIIGDMPLIKITTPKLLKHY